MTLDIKMNLTKQCKAISKNAEETQFKLGGLYNQIRVIPCEGMVEYVCYICNGKENMVIAFDGQTKQTSNYLSSIGVAVAQCMEDYNTYYYVPLGHEECRKKWQRTKLF
jgi:hypothetical protein